MYQQSQDKVGIGFGMESETVGNNISESVVYNILLKLTCSVHIPDSGSGFQIIIVLSIEVVSRHKGCTGLSPVLMKRYQGKIL